MKNIFLFLPLFFLCAFLGNAQETILKHTVSKGETVFQLSRKYNVTPEEIYALNPSAVDVITIGEVLSIPKKENQYTTTASTANDSNYSVITYAVLYGDTKYSLARRYGITVEALEQQNPHTKNGLQAGHILKIQSQRNSSETSANFIIKKTHLVLKGQTLWGISKENSLTVEELVNANSDILNGILQTGQILKIPNPYEIPNNSASDSYLVQRGDTKYGLSKKYGITIDKLEKTNPQIVRMLMAGQTIRIPNESNQVGNQTSVDEMPSQTDVAVVTETTVSDTADPITSNDTLKEPIEELVEETTIPKLDATETTIPETSNVSSFENYAVKPNETLYGLSKKADMSISDFVSLNPELANGVKVGMIIKMPSNTSSPTETINPSQPNPKTSNENYVDLSKSITTVKKNHILLFLPFSESKYTEEYQTHEDFNNVSNDFLKEHLEFYRGAKIAQDSAKALGLDFIIQIIETDNSKRNTKASSLAKEKSAENYDALLLPFYENDSEEIAKLLKDKNIPIVTAGTVSENQGLNNLFNSVPSANSKRDVLLDYMTSKNGNIIVVCDVSRKESKTYISNHAPNAQFIEVNKKGSFNDDELVSMLDSNKVNYVILESEKNSVFLSTTNSLLGQLSNYSIQLALLDKSLIPNTDDVSQKRFVILQMLYPSLVPLEASYLSSNFIKSYKKRFGVEPPQNAKIGFDLTFDTLLRLSQAKSFENSAKTDITEYTTLRFDYKLNEMGSYDNNGIFMIQYNTDATLKEVK